MNCLEHLSHREWGSVRGCFNIMFVKGNVQNIRIRELLRATCKLSAESSLKVPVFQAE